MVSPHGIQLATHLISSSYGELCSKVCDCLLRRGALSLAQIIRFEQLSRDNSINCLRVLIHQNCVQAYSVKLEGSDDESERYVTYYIALFDNIINKYRAPKFMQIVAEELGNDCLEIFLGLIQHGRLSLNQIVDRNGQTAGRCDVHILREHFKRLLNSRFIERCPAPDPVLDPPLQEEAPAKKRGAKKSKIAEESLTIEQRVFEAAVPMESLRFLMEMDYVSEEQNLESAMRSKLGEKRKQETTKFDEGLTPAGEEKEILWRVNYEEFVFRLKAKNCVLYVKSKMNDEAGIVLSAILELTKKAASGRKFEASACLPINAIYDEVIKKDGGIDMDFERIRVSLSQLGCTCSEGNDESYSIDLKGIIEMAKNEEVESMILKRYGREAYRIFRLLSKTGRFLDNDKISDDTFVEKNDTLKILFKLWKDNYMHMEKFEGNAPKQQPILLWRVNKQPLCVQFLDEMYHAALNLRLRIIHEQDQGKEILQLPREKLVGDLEKRYKQMGRTKIILESSLINLDDAILLFQDC